MKNETETDSPDINRLHENEEEKIKTISNKEEMIITNTNNNKSPSQDHMIKYTNEDISMNDSDDNSMDIDETIENIKNLETKIDSSIVNADESKEKGRMELDKDIFKDASTEANKTVKPTEEITDIIELGDITIQEFNNWIRSESSSTLLICGTNSRRWALII